MRFIVFLLGLLGSLLTGFFGWFWLDYVNCQVISELAQDYDVNIGVIMPDYVTDFENTVRAGMFLAVGGLFGIMGSLMTLCRHGRQGAVLMIVAALGPALFKPETLIFTSLLAFAGLLSLFVKPGYLAEAD
jgi:hypothetical protein